ncbi:AraC family transcriptional regulator [Luteibacter sp. CQ10]
MVVDADDAPAAGHAVSGGDGARGDVLDRSFTVDPDAERGRKIERAVVLLDAFGERIGGVVVSDVPPCPTKARQGIRCRHPIAYRARIRTLHALDAMASSRSLVQIAADCGFSDQAHLTRSFSALTDTSPSTWRRRLARS